MIINYLIERKKLNKFINTCDIRKDMQNKKKSTSYLLSIYVSQHKFGIGRAAQIFSGRPYFRMNGCECKHYHNIFAIQKYKT